MTNLQRNIIISKARAEYIPSQTKNISTALKLYLAKSKEKVPLVISKKTGTGNILDRLGRPKCPNCNFDLYLRVVKPCKKGNKFDWRSCWECLNCAYEKYNKETIDQLLANKRRK